VNKIYLDILQDLALTATATRDCEKLRGELNSQHGACRPRLSAVSTVRLCALARDVVNVWRCMSRNQIGSAPWRRYERACTSATDTTGIEGAGWWRSLTGTGASQLMRGRAYVHGSRPFRARRRPLHPTGGATRNVVGHSHDRPAGTRDPAPIAHATPRPAYSDLVVDHHAKCKPGVTLATWQ
jgi:hypothetical protein